MQLCTFKNDHALEVFGWVGNDVEAGRVAKNKERKGVTKKQHVRQKGRRLFLC